MTISNIPIESNIPIPPPRKCVGLKRITGNLAVGQSIFLENRKLNSVRSYCHTLSKLHEFRLIARAVEGGVRVWRTE